METTSSPTSSEPSRARNAVALAGWLALAAAQITLAFIAQSAAGNEDELIYDYSLALSTVPVYGLLVALTFAIALAYPNPARSLGLRAFEWRWFWIAFATIVLAILVGGTLEAVFGLDAGEEQGLGPESWRPEQLPAFLVNAFVMVTVVPFTEELFYRGLGMRALAVFGGLAAVVGTAAAFSLAHGIPVAIPTLMVFALGLGWVRLRSESVWPGVIAHGLYNALVLALSLATLQ